MVFGAPNESYDPDRASRLLHSLGEVTTSNAISNLLARSVLSKSNRDPRRLKPGRSLKISEMSVIPLYSPRVWGLTVDCRNQNALGGTVSRDTFLDAIALDDIATEEEEDWHSWPLMSNDGDTAALIQLVSENKVFGYDNYLGCPFIFSCRLNSRLIPHKHRLLAPSWTGTARKLVKHCSLWHDDNNFH